ncbi:unnamed protein product [Malus baccata var. baccata]
MNCRVEGRRFVSLGALRFDFSSAKYPCWTKWNPPWTFVLTSYLVSFLAIILWRVYALDKRGVFPKEFVALRYLTFLEIDENYFTGPLPAFIGNMSALTLLSIGGNSFSGPIPKELGNLKELTYFYLDSCGLGGEIPSTFAKLTNMRILQFQGNSFGGPIPTSFSQLTSLKSLKLRNVLITGTIPSDIGEYQSLQKLYRFVLKIFIRKLSPVGDHNIATSSWIELPPEKFSMQSKCPTMGSDGILYETEDLALGPTTFNVTSTEKWAVSNSGSDFPPTVSGLSPTTPGKKSRTGLIVGIAVPVGAVSLLLIFAILYMRKKSEKEDEEGFSALTLTHTSKNAFTKGTLSDGRVVAVKQLSVASHQGKSQFVYEIATISVVKLRNLVKSYGCCIEGSHRILVYEYLENKSLDHALFDFGLAKLYDDEKTHISTRVAGTIGYLAPEYALFGHLTEKADVFGFGVVILEILSGRPNSYNNLDPEKIYLLEWVWTLHGNDQTLGLVDPRLTEFDETEVTRLIRAALLCTQGSPMARSSMSRVVAMLFGDIDIGTVMSKPSYLTDYNFKDVTTFSTSRFLVEDGTPSTASKDSNVHLNYQSRGSNASGANTPWIDPVSSVNITHSLLTGIIGEGRVLRLDYHSFNQKRCEDVLIDFGLTNEAMVGCAIYQPNQPIVLAKLIFGNRKKMVAQGIWHVWTLHENDQTLGLVDSRLTEFDETEATRLIRAALLCTQGSPMARPSMSRVVAMLSGDIDIGTVMSKQSYLTDYNFKDVTTFSTGRFLVEDDTPSTASKHSYVRLNYQPKGSNASGGRQKGKGFGVVLVEPNRHHEESFVFVAFSIVAASVYEVADEFQGGGGGRGGGGAILVNCGQTALFQHASIIDITRRNAHALLWVFKP